MKKLLPVAHCILAVIVSCLTMPARAYDESTHVIITKHAAERSVLYGAQSILTDWGYSDPQSISFTSYPSPFDTISGRVQWGVKFEDDLTETKRVFNHFFDPQNGGRPLQVGINLGHPSPLWALEDTGEVQSIPVNFQLWTLWVVISEGGVQQNFSFRHASQHFFASLTASAPGTRFTEMGTTFETLGHVVHHLQDMGQPQHTRNDIHPPFDMNGSWYEDYTKDYINNGSLENGSYKLASLLNDRPYNGGIVPTFSTAREFWSQAPVPGPRFRGMADYTAQNFISLRTNFGGSVASNGTVSITANPEFPLPNGVNHDGTLKYLEKRTRNFRMQNGVVKQWSPRFLIGRVYDEYTGESVEHMLASESSLAVFQRARGVALSFETDTAVFDDNYPALLPRASAFSTGLINHFFRGKLDLQRTTASGTDWTISNVGTQPMNGEFYVYRDDGLGTRSLAAGPFVRSVAAGGTTIIPVTEPPSTTSKMVAVFRGQIGAEGNVSSGFFAVAGKVVPYTPQSIPCGTPIKAAGSTEGFNNTLYLGSTAGTVYGEFEAYNIPDGLVVTRTSNGQVLYSTGGKVPLYHTFNFSTPGGSDTATNTIRLVVTGGTTGTQWTLTVGCPNHVIGDPDRVMKRVDIAFFTNPQPGTGCADGTYDITLDGVLMATLAYGGSGQSTLNKTVSEGTNHDLKIVQHRNGNGQFGNGCQTVSPFIRTSRGDRNIGIYVGTSTSTFAIP